MTEIKLHGNNTNSETILRGILKTASEFLDYQY